MRDKCNVTIARKVPSKGPLTNIECPSNILSKKFCLTFQYSKVLPTNILFEARFKNLKNVIVSKHYLVWNYFGFSQI